MKLQIRLVLLAALTAAVAFTPPSGRAAVILGGDFGGANLTVANGDILSGTFTNVGTFSVGAGVTAFVAQGIALSISASVLDIDGTIDGTGRGFAGGASVLNAPGGLANDQGGLPGQGPGGGGAGLIGPGVHGSGGGGGGHGGAGGSSAGHSSLAGGSPAAGGLSYGSTTSPAIDMGSGGGSGSKYIQASLPGASGAGGAGGGAVSLFGNVLLDGAIIVDGAAGLPGTTTNKAAGGGGAGGGILLFGDLVLDGLLSAIGGDGGDGTLGGGGFDSGGGGGGGGRIKLFATGLTLAPGFAAGVGGGAPGAGVTLGGPAATGGAGGSLYIENIRTVSEPYSIALTVLALGLLAGARRRMVRAV